MAENEDVKPEQDAAVEEKKSKPAKAQAVDHQKVCVALLNAKKK
jgi:hypothetical protein